MSDAPPQAGAMLHGPGGLLATPGLGASKRRRKWGMRTKDKQIAGNLYRADATGRFTSGNGPSSDAPPQFGKGAPKPKKGRKGRARTPKQTPEQRAQASAAKRAQNASDVARQMAANDTGLSPSGSKALLAFASGTPPDPQIAAGLVQMGLAEQASDGSYRMTPTGHAAVSAMQAGDYQRAVDAVSRGTDAQGKRTQRQQERTARQQASAAKRQDAEAKRQARRQEIAARRAAKPAKAGSGGSKKPATPEKEQPIKVAPSKRAARSSAPNVGGVAGAAANKKPEAQPKPEQAPAKQIAPALQEAAQQLSAGDAIDPQDVQALVRNGLARLDKDGQPSLTAAGLRATQKSYAIARWNGQAWIKDGVVVAEPDQSQFAGYTMEDHDDDDNPRRKPSREDVEKARAQFAQALGIDTVAQPSTFTVFKDHTGALRWIARTTTAYKDRDGEIISEAALDQDSLRMMATKQFGPLRWWHVGDPDPANVANPAGPGLDIGDCDYSVVIGRTRVESGTFRDERIARKVASVADGLEMSPGFFHPLDQPDRAGVFASIRTFERSIVPTRYSRASNLFTGFTVKEFRMDVSEMERRFKAMYTELGLTPEQGADLGQQLVATEKAAAQQGIAFKDAAPELPDVVLNGVTYKAVPPPAPADAGATTVEAKADMPAMDAEPDAADPMEAMEGEAEGDYIGDMGVDAFKAMLAELLAPLIKALDISGKMAGQIDELKSMMGGVATKEAGVSAELTALKAQQAELAGKIAEIEGSQPATVLPDDVAAALKSAGPAQAQEPEAKKIESTPERPWAGWGAQTFPDLYKLGEQP